MNTYRLELGWAGSPPEWRRFIEKLEQDGLLSDNEEDRTPQIVEHLKKYNALHIPDSNYTIEFDSYDHYVMWVLAYS